MEDFMRTTPNTDNEQLLADLVWEFREKVKNQENVAMHDFLQRCPDQRSRMAFKELVNMDLLLDSVSSE